MGIGLLEKNNWNDDLKNNSKKKYVKEKDKNVQENVLD